MTHETIALREIAYARSGDKGINANVGIIAYTPEGYQFLKNILSVEKVNAYFSPLEVVETLRYELPNLEAFNFVLKGILEGGGSRSLRVDAQGKTLGQALLEMEIQIPKNIYDLCRRNDGISQSRYDLSSSSHSKSE